MSTNHGPCVPLSFLIQTTGDAAIRSSNRAIALTERAEKAEAAVNRVRILANYLDTLADGDRRYAAAIRTALEGSP